MARLSSTFESLDPLGDTYWWFRTPFLFDAKATRALFNKMVTENPAAAENKSTTVFGKVEIYKHYHREQDLNFFIYAFFKYGNRSKALLDAGTATAAISKKFDDYGINADYKPNSYYRQLTPSRIARAFPVHAATVILNENFPGVLQYSSLFREELPLIMQHTIFPGLVPEKQFHRELHQIATVLNMETSVKLSGTEDKKQMMASTLGDRWKYSNLYVEGVLNLGDGDDDKLKVLQRAGILEAKADGELKLSVITVSLLKQSVEVYKLSPLKYSEALDKLAISDLKSPPSLDNFL